MKPVKIYPVKHLGQVFLEDKKYLNFFLKALEIKPKEIIIEVGPGKGIITRALLAQETYVIGIEKDCRLVDFLDQQLSSPQLILIEADILLIYPKLIQNFSQIPFKLTGNIPFYLTSQLIKVILENEIRPQLIVLGVQKEVAQRLVAKAPHNNLLAITTQFFADSKIIAKIPKKAFRPQPKVDSAIIQLRPYNYFKYQLTPAVFFPIVKAGFKQPRKYLLSNLSQNLNLSKIQLENIFQQLNIPSNARAQELSLEQWLELAKKILEIQSATTKNLTFNNLTSHN